MEPYVLNVIMILCFIFGSGLIILEAFMPGFGAAGICGVVLEAGALWAVWSLHGVTAALLALAGVLLLLGVAVFLSYRSAVNGRISRSPLVLNDTAAPGASFSPDPWLGREGVTVTALRPEGEIEIDGVRMKAASGGDFVSKGASVRVCGAENGRLLVRVES